MSPNLLRVRLLALTLLFGSPQCWPQAAQPNTIHWAYSTYFGTGWYQIGDERDAFAVRYAPRKQLRLASINDDGTRTTGMEWRFPITVGLDQFPLDDLPGTVDLGNLANVSFTPGVYFEIPINERWSLRPYAAIGWGTVLDGDESSWTYWAGMKSRFILSPGRLETALVNSATFVGYSPNNGPSANFWPIMTALEFRHPVSTLVSGDELRLHWRLSYTFFQDDLDVLERDTASEPISDQWELGAAFSLRDRPIAFWKFRFDRVGLAYRVSSDGNLKGVGLIFESLFDQ